MEISLFCLPVSGMMHSQIAFRELIVRPAVDHTTMKEPRPEMTASLLANTHLNAALEQHWEGRVSLISMYVHNTYSKYTA